MLWIHFFLWTRLKHIPTTSAGKNEDLRTVYRINVQKQIWWYWYLKMYWLIVSCGITHFCYCFLFLFFTLLLFYSDFIRRLQSINQDNRLLPVVYRWSITPQKNFIEIKCKTSKICFLINSMSTKKTGDLMMRTMWELNWCSVFKSIRNKSLLYSLIGWLTNWGN